MAARVRGPIPDHRTQPERHNAGVDVFVETERLVLRRFTRDDLDLLVELDSDPGVKRYIDNGAPVDRTISPACWTIGSATTSATTATGSGPPSRSRPAASSDGSTCVPATGAGPDEPELGYRLHRDAWGPGYATEGSKALVDKAFAELGVERVYATTMNVNIASCRVMEKAGLRFVRTFHADWPVRIPGDEEGDVEYAIDRAQWESDRTSG